MKKTIKRVAELVIIAILIIVAIILYDKNTKRKINELPNKTREIYNNAASSAGSAV